MYGEFCETYSPNAEKNKNLTPNIKEAISGLEIYLKTIEKMNEDEFDYCYSKLTKLGIDNLEIEKLIYWLKNDV